MTSQLPDGLDTHLTRAQLAEALTSAGFPISTPTLATMVTRGGGPPYSKWGPRASYRWGDALAWAKARRAAPRRSSSEPISHNVNAA